MTISKIRKADIARRERLTRARVTQIMSLLKLPEAVKLSVLAGNEPKIIRGAPGGAIDLRRPRHRLLQRLGGRRVSLASFPPFGSFPEPLGLRALDDRPEFLQVYPVFLA